MTHSERVIRQSGLDSGAAVQKQEAADQRLEALESQGLEQLST